MKRIVTVLLASFAVCALPLAAQNAAKLPAQNKAPAFRAGLFGSGEASLGDYASYIGARAGGGLSAEFALPLFGGKSGVSVEAQGDGLFASSDKVSGGWSGSALAGVWYYLPLGKGAFAFQPELSAGVVVRGIQTQDDMQDMPSGAYVDFAVQLAPSFRFSPASLKGFEFELSPVYTIIPVQGNAEHFVGGRIGVRYTVQGKSKESGQVQSEESEKVQSDKINGESEGGN